jgi:AraC-like DNA-binding protein
MTFAEYPLVTDEGGIPFLLCGIGSYDHQPPVKRPEGYCIHQLMYVTEGKGILVYNGYKYELNKNDLVLLGTNVPYEYYATIEPWSVSWVTFTGHEINFFLNKFDFETIKVVHLHNTELMDMMFSNMVTMLRSKQKNKVYRCSPLLYEMILEIFYQTKNSLDRQYQTEDDYLNTAISYMNQNYQENITLEDIAEAALISPEYLCILFKKHLHMRPFEYLSKKRIQKAKHLLSDTVMPISDVGKAVGYDSNSYFGYVFKKYELMSPTQFRGFLR